LPKFAVIVLCRLIVEISNPNSFCRREAVSAELGDGVPATCGCACTEVFGVEDILASMSEVDVEDAAASADGVEVEDTASPIEVEVDEPAPSTELADMMTVLAASAVDVAPARPPTVSVAELILGAEVGAMGCGAPVVGLPPALIVTCEPDTEARVCRVDGGTGMLPKPSVLSWKGWA
jgi:hypothetical protein